MAAFLACLVLLLLGIAGGGYSVTTPPFLYRLNDATQEPCVLMEATNITTPDAPMPLYDMTVNTAMSSCHSGQGNILLVLSDTDNFLKFLFGIDNSSSTGYWTLKNVNFTSSTDGSLANTLNQFYCLRNQSFQCDSQTDILLVNNTITPKKTLVLSISGWKVQAFSFTNQTFDTARHCVQDYQSSKVVPTVVGAAMAGLIFVVLVAYVISQIRNWRSQRASHGSYGRL